MADWFVFIAGWLWAVIAPFSKHYSSSKSLLLVLRWALHFLLVLLCLFVLKLLHEYSGFQRFVRSPGPGIREHWLQFFFLILYGHIWMIWFLWFYSSFFLDSSPFPDIDSDWDSSLKTTKIQSVDISTTPIFLTIGHPVSGVNHLLKLHSQNINNMIWQDSLCLPTVDGVFITYGNNCGLGALESKLAGEYLESWKLFSENQSVSGFDFIADTGNDVNITSSSNSESITPSGAPLSESLPLQTSTSRKVSPSIVPVKTLKKDAGTFNLPREGINRRCSYFTNKVVDLRFPLCPANGIAVVVPIPYLTQLNINSILASAQNDLLLIRDNLQIECPIFVFFSDIDQVPGFEEVAPLLKLNKSNEPFGVAFSSCSNNLDSNEVAKKITNAVTWSLIEWLPKTIYPFLKKHNTTRNESASVVRFLSILWKLEPVLSQFAAKLLTPDNKKPFLAGGCFFIATGNEQNLQDFYEPAFKNMVKLQNFVSWTSLAFYQDRIRTIFTWIGYLLLLIWISFVFFLLWNIVF